MGSGADHSYSPALLQEKPGDPLHFRRGKRPISRTGKRVKNYQLFTRADSPFLKTTTDNFPSAVRDPKFGYL
jgi:hypothetical protein